MLLLSIHPWRTSVAWLQEVLLAVPAKALLFVGHELVGRPKLGVVIAHGQRRIAMRIVHTTERRCTGKPNVNITHPRRRTQG